MKYFWITNNENLNFSVLFSIIYVIWRRYEFLKSDKYFENCLKCVKKHLIDVNEEPQEGDTTLDIGV